MRGWIPLFMVALLVGACGDPDFATQPSSNPDAPPPAGPQGFVSAQIDAMQFTRTLPAASVVRNGRFGFGMSIPEFPDLLLSVATPAHAGEWEVGTANSPFAAVTVGTGAEAQRWIASFVAGTGRVTVNSLMDDEADGHFEFELVPDSATARAGVVATRMMSGSFYVRLMR